MTLSPGTRLGPYTVVSPLGAGGMGEVYRATDTRLNRDVALKILPDAFARDADRLARFQREAQMLASLNHQNIGAIHGLEEDGGIKALVLELVDGPTLADRLASGPLPLAEAVTTAKQIADALDAAHEHGVVHRDLKPSNIKLRADGTVKVLDFGLAKTTDSARSDIDLTQSPTLVSPAVTQAGFILGTAAYMSPEQARGRNVDKRSDIWAFGCVLYEMLTGARAYEGDDVTDTMAAILRGEPDWTRMPAEVPGALVRVVKRCLEKDRRQRRHDIADVRMDIDDAMTAPSVNGATTVARRWTTGHLAAGAAAILVAAGIGAAIAWNARPASPPPMVRRFALPLGPNENYSNIGRHVLALSPDGAHLVYVANSRLNLRHLSQLTSTVIAGTESTGAAAREPFFSPDGQSIGYWAEGRLKRVALAGGAPVALAETQNPFGASWSADDTILYGAVEGIWRLPGAGGTPELVIKAADGELLHGPQLLPDGEHVLFTRGSRAATWDEANIVAQSLRTGQRTVVLKGGRDARYLPTGHLVYGVKDALLAVRFDASTLKTGGGAASMVENVANAGSASGASQFAIAHNGALAYISEGRAARGSFVWIDRSGREDPTPASAEIAGVENPRLSPDGRRLALISEGSVWVQDLEGRPPIKLTFDGPHYSPIWSADGTRIFFEASGGVMSLAADGSGKPEPASPAGHLHAHAATRDGEIIVARLPDGTASKSTDILRLMPGPKAEMKPVVATASIEGIDGLSLSADGRWLAYSSNATGASEIWVQPYPGPGAAVRVSPNGGVEPVWSRHGRELYYLEGRRLMVVAVQPGSLFSFSPAVRLFDNPHPQRSQPPTYDVAADGRFLMIKGSGPQVTPPIVLTLDWFEELSRRLP
jgi:eukaryotic-like serine/threonine-protein kinase